MCLLYLMSGIVYANAQESIGAVTGAIEQFVQAGDRQNAEHLEKLLHPDYRVVWNMPDKGTTTVLDRATYLTMIREKKIGGDDRQLTIESVEMIEGGNALVRTVLHGEKADFNSLFSLVQDKTGSWLLVQDQVYMLVR